jgi:putative methionine-R-sulfoxide reductase with GAF domain
MFAVEKVSGSKSEIYEELARQTRGLLDGERDLIANAANVAALIWQIVPDLNWAGFYLMKRGELVLGPFQGKPACVRIAVGKGVCGGGGGSARDGSRRRRACVSRAYRMRLGVELGARRAADQGRRGARRA